MKDKHAEALKDVLAEMQRQDAKWGADRNLDLSSRVASLGRMWGSLIRPLSMTVIEEKQPVPADKKRCRLLRLRCKSSNITIPYKPADLGSLPIVVLLATPRLFSALSDLEE